MNKALKIGIVATSAAITIYFGVKIYLRNKAYKEASGRFRENDTDKKLIIMQILISKGENPDNINNINNYLNYSIEELKSMLDIQDTSEYSGGDYSEYGYGEYGGYGDYQLNS